MALSGIEIFKFLPKTNCKECGVPTCLAFAMALAQGKAELSACPYVSDEAKEKLSVFKPATLGHASRISGITPADITVIQVHLRKRSGSQAGDTGPQESEA